MSARKTTSARKTSTVRKTAAVRKRGARKTVSQARTRKSTRTRAPAQDASRTSDSVPSTGAIRELVKSAEARRVLQQLDELCAGERRGALDFGGGRKLAVTNLDKKFFREGYSKGDLLRYYTIVAGLILPTIRDRPLVLRRFPNGIHGPAFYQQKAMPDTPRAVRVETVVNDAGERQRRMVGGELLTLLYTIQLGAVSVDPWHSRVGTLDYADYSVVDLDPGSRTPFRRVVDAALWVRDVLDDYGLHAALKTSGSTGLHVYIPLPANTPNEAATLVAQLIATRVAEQHPKHATIVRWVKQRGEGRVYMDYLQNIRGKTLAGAYCVRAKDGATVSTPLDWSELEEPLDPRDFTIVTAPERFAERGDIWGKVMKRRNSLTGVTAR